METDFEFSDFIESINYDTKTSNVVDDIKYLIEKISVIEKRYKILMDKLLKEYYPDFVTMEERMRRETQKRKRKEEENEKEEKAKEIFKKEVENENLNEQKTNKSQDHKEKVENEKIPEEIPEENPEIPMGNKPSKNLEPILDKLIHRMYKKIALKYHPDKYKNKSDKNKNKYQSVFIGATEALNDLNLVKMLYIFGLEKIKMEFTEKELEYISLVKIHLEQKLSDFLRNPLSRWEMLSNDEKKYLAERLKRVS